MNSNLANILHYGAALVLLAAGVVGEVVPLPGIDAHVALMAGLGILGVGGKADAALKMFPFALVTAALLFGGGAYAADLKPILKASSARASVNTGCTIVSCVGVFVGGSIANDGGNFDIVGTGLQGVANNQSLGGQAGVEYFRNSIYAAGLIHVNYDMALNAAGSGITDKLSYGVCGRLGYSLASFFGAGATGQATPTLPAALANALMTPYVNICEDRRHGQPAIGTGAGLEALLSQYWTVNADYLHYSFNQGGSTGGPLPVTQKDENAVMFSVNYHPLSW